jgi:hypothetical protein
LKLFELDKYLHVEEIDLDNIGLQAMLQTEWDCKIVPVDVKADSQVLIDLKHVIAKTGLKTFDKNINVCNCIEFFVSTLRIK